MAPYHIRTGAIGLMIAEFFPLRQATQVILVQEIHFSRKIQRKCDDLL